MVEQDINPNPVSHPGAGEADPVNIVPAQDTLEAFALEPGCLEGVSVGSLETGTTLDVVTRHSCYHFVVLDGPEGRVLVNGGTLFPEPTTVHILGATSGGSALKMKWIGVGLRLELSKGRRRITTSRVQSVTIEPQTTTH